MALKFAGERSRKKHSAYASLRVTTAMNVRAPEFKALMIIFRSTGTVISTRRASRSPGTPVGSDQSVLPDPLKAKN
jgi:hypothetical protein